MERGSAAPGGRGDVGLASKPAAILNDAVKIAWKVSARDAEFVRDFCGRYERTRMVRERRKKNLGAGKKPTARSRVWEKMVICLLTTQQKSGPKSSVARLARTKPFPLSYRQCRRRKNLRGFVLQRLTHFGGIRRTRTIAGEVAQNRGLLESGLWRRLLRRLADLSANPRAAQEREVADFVRVNLHGFGPKQSRNLLQMLRLTRYEVPVDSRLTKWLNEFGFPLQLNAANLADASYHALVNDGIQALCAKAGVYPCVLDAAIFTSFDQPAKRGVTLAPRPRAGR